MTIKQKPACRARCVSSVHCDHFDVSAAGGIDPATYDLFCVHVDRDPGTTRSLFGSNEVKVGRHRNPDPGTPRADRNIGLELVERHR